MSRTGLRALHRPPPWTYAAHWRLDLVRNLETQNLDQGPQVPPMGVHKYHPGQASGPTNCSARRSNWKKHLDDGHDRQSSSAKLRRPWATKFSQFINTRGLPPKLNHGMFEPRPRPTRTGRCRTIFGVAGGGICFRGTTDITATKHQREVGTKRLFRCGFDGDHRRQVLDHSDGPNPPNRPSSSRRPSNPTRPHPPHPDQGRVERHHQTDPPTSQTPARGRKCTWHPRPASQERAEEQSSAMDADQQAAIRMLANDLAPASTTP